MVIVDETGTIVLVNSQTEKIFGYSREELVCQPVEVLVPDRFRAQHEGDWSRYFSEPHRRGMGAGHELYGLRKNGGEFPVEINLNPLKTRDGLLVSGSIRDLTLRRSADAKFRALLETAPDPMVIVKKTGEITLVNSQTERLFGYTRDELFGQPIEILLPERFRTNHPGGRGGYFSEPRVRELAAGLNLHGIRKNGEEFPVEISLSPLETEEGLLVSRIRDVSDRRRVERALQEKNIELERANLAKDRFLASMSHELRTPLNAIIGFTGTLLMRLPGPLTDAQDHQLQTVQRSARHLLSLINDLLDLTKIESGKVELQTGPIACEVVLGEIVTALRPLAEAKGLVFELQIPAGKPQVRADRRAFSQILINLANNAIKFTDSGRVRVEVADAPAGAPTVEIRIIDTGVGISSEDQEKLFKAFTQLTTARHYDGTGLGLHLSQKLAGLLGGSIRLTSEPGVGSTFVLSLPRA